jgi:outer membrane protein assembly factor BamB/tRNA A-37 threonylcarbamoyl transferase component Bud32
MAESVDTQKFPGRQLPLGSPEGALENNTVLQNRWRISGVLGVGGMATVYKARDLHFPNVVRHVAVKEMLNLSPDPALRETTLRIFEREADLLASLSHPAVVEIYDYFSIRDRAYLVMEYIEGRDLEAIVNSVPESIKVALAHKWAIGLCDVLHYLHSHKNEAGEPEPIVFRDVKPSNIMIDQRGNVRLIDFGIAKTFQVGQKGTMIGTEGYSPPEQYKGEASPRGDIYALGATLHHILTRRDPRLEPPFSFTERPIREYNADASAEFEAVIMRALAYLPEERYSDAGAMKAALERIRPVFGAAPTQVVAPTEIKPATSFFLTGVEVVPIWKFRCEDEVRSSPVIADGFVYVGCYDNGLYCLNAADGSFNWRYATEGGIASSPAVEGDKVYFGSDDYALYALTARNGRIQWTYATQGPVRSSPRVALGHVFIGSDDTNLYAIKAVNGRKAWGFAASGPIRSSAWVTGERVYFGCESGDFYAVDLAGSIKWSFKARRGITSSPIVHDGVVFFGSLDWHVYALDAENGFTVWRHRTGKAVVCSPVVDKKNVYIGSADGVLYALNAANHRERWTFETEGQITSRPAVCEGAIYFGSTDGYVYSLEARSGQLRWKFKAEGPVVSSPCVHEGVVYIGSLDNFVYALTA